jgi:transcriptional regulator with XRE-family HTH domain
MNPEWFGGRLRELREAAGLTQQQLADRAGLTREGVAQLEIGRRQPAWKTVLVMCEALGCGCEEFTRAPAERPEAKPGRPSKAAPQPQEPKPPKKRGRPRKAE